MKKIVLIIGLVCSTIFANAQEAEKVGIKNTEYEVLKKVSIKNLDKDTYIKEGAFVLDNSNPPYVFKFSDGKERRIYLYKVLEAAGMKELGSLMVFTTPKDGKKINLIVPNPLAEKEVWGKYIDDLKDGEKAIMGFSSCVAFVLAKEFTGGASGSGHGDEDKYEYCFPASANVTMADGSAKAIDQVQVGDQVMAYNAKTKMAEKTIVDKVQVHENKQFPLVKALLVSATDDAYASTNNDFQLVELEATANHPVMTTAGTTKMGNLKVGEQVLMYNTDNKSFTNYKVFATKADFRKVEKVYNLLTTKDNYLINSIVVLEK
ncbi:Hint domain-containing protein [Flectobacillus major]|uniref:Hint domain-containing protein n=1 Tax=Flectobacillus major TaxID=103 RepID=UPI00040C3E72|nr:Hint domain-containing protein [Flectobacillus major]